MIIIIYNGNFLFRIGCVFESFLKMSLLNLCHVCEIGKEIVNWENKFGISILRGTVTHFAENIIILTSHEGQRRRRPHTPWLLHGTGERKFTVENSLKVVAAAQPSLHNEVYLASLRYRRGPPRRDPFQKRSEMGSIFASAMMPLREYNDI